MIGGTGPGLRIYQGSKHIIEGVTIGSVSGNSAYIKEPSSVVYIGNNDSANPVDLQDPRLHCVINSKGGSYHPPYILFTRVFLLKQIRYALRVLLLTP